MRYLAIIIVLASIGAAQDQVTFTGTLCQGWDQRLTPEGPTDTFATDNATVRLVYKASKAPAKGAVLTPIITAMVDGKEQGILRGKPTVANGQSDVFATGFMIAGHQWAQAGGDFRFRVFMGDTPVLNLPFKVNPSKRWALLVGISDYPPAGRHAGDGDLPACADDAMRMRDLLIKSFGFQAANITTVLNLEATSTRIARELRTLAGKAGPNDAVLFYYVGHGTQIPDLSGDEADGWDEALHTADPKPKLMTTEDHLKLVLSDDQIAELLQLFKTKNVTVIFDACHSGTAVRAGEDEEIDAPGFYTGMKKDQGFGRKLIEKAEDTERNNPKGVAAGLDIDQRYVFLSAAQSWETGMTNRFGCFFSRELRAALRTANGQSWDQIMKRVRPRVQRTNPGQAPQVIGASRRFPFSLTEAAQDAAFERPTVAVVGGWNKAEPNKIKFGANQGQIALVSGMSSLYLENGGIAYDVYSAGSGLSGKPKGRVVLTGKLQVIKRPGTSSLAYASANVIRGSVFKGDRLIPLSVKVPDARPAVAMSLFNNTTAQMKQRLQQIINAVIGLLSNDRSINMVTTSGVRVDYIVVPFMKDGQFLANIYTPRNQYVGSCRGSANDIASNVREFVTKRHQEFTRISRLSNTSPSLRMRVVMEGGVTRRRAGTPVKFKGYVDQPAYLYAFAATEGGFTAFVVASKAPLKPNVPFDFTMNSNSKFKGRMVMKVIASTKPLDVNAINNAKPMQRADALFAALRKAYPGGGADQIGTTGWAEESVWVEFR